MTRKEVNFGNRGVEADNSCGDEAKAFSIKWCMHLKT